MDTQFTSTIRTVDSTVAFVVPLLDGSSACQILFVGVFGIISSSQKEKIGSPYPSVEEER
jgi:hypothetical protein